MKRFTGTAIALVCFVLVLAVYWIGSGPGVAPEEQQPELFQFEPDDLVGIKIEHPKQPIVLTQVDSVWRLEGKTWRPSRSMVRRVGHQLHDLTARASSRSRRRISTSMDWATKVFELN